MATPSSIRRIATASSLRCQCLLDSAASRTPSHTSRRISRHHATPSSSRSFSSAPYISSEPDNEAASQPRWRSTPKGMSMPFRVRPVDKNNQWRVNEDPKKLNDFYARLLGPGGESMLTEETKWLAITHKSFDQGRRGYNDKLSYFGRRVLELHTSQALLIQPIDPSSIQQAPDSYGRYPFEHPLLEGLPNLSEQSKSSVLGKNRLAQLGKDHGLQGVLRWKPKKVDNLSGSGLELVMAQAVYAIVGAVSLERGAVVASRIAKERILRPLGIETSES